MRIHTFLPKTRNPSACALVRLRFSCVEAQLPTSTHICHAPLTVSRTIVSLSGPSLFENVALYIELFLRKGYKGKFPSVPSAKSSMSANISDTQLFAACQKYWVRHGAFSLGCCGLYEHDPLRTCAWHIVIRLYRRVWGNIRDSNV